MDQFAARIRMHRALHRIDQNELATQLGVSRTIISYWENGHVRPNTKAVRKLAEVLGIPVEQALKEIE